MRLKATIDWILAGYVVVALMLVALLASAAPPKGANPNSAIGLWFQSLLVPHGRYAGTSCCGAADGRTTELRQTATGWEAWINEKWNVSPGRWVPVPPETILDRMDNPMGEPVVFWTPDRGVICVIRAADI